MAFFNLPKEKIMTVRNMSGYIATKESKVPQTMPLPNSDQVANSGGGFSFLTDKWGRLSRFLILGTEGGTFYISEQNLTVDNAKSVIECIKEDGLRVVTEIIKISDEGRAKSNDPALMALSLCATYGDLITKRAAFRALPKVARTGTHLFHFVEFFNAQRGWGRAAKHGIANWYLSMPVDQLAYQIIKYQQRDGWSHKDILRLSHPNPERSKDPEKCSALFKWVTKKDDVIITSSLPNIVKAFELAKTANETGVIDLILNHNLPREAIPTHMLNSKAVWEALLQKMPMMAMIRNLNKLTNLGLIDGDNGGKIVEALNNQEKIANSRMHPIALYNAYKTYSLGRGEKGSLTWRPDGRITEALMEAFYLSFKGINPSNKKTMLALDVSDSMTWHNIPGLNLNPREGSAIMSMVTARAEPWYMFKAFSTGLMNIDINSSDTLNQALIKIRRLPAAGTNCSAPMIWATKNKVEVDTFVIYTDNETNYQRDIHPIAALKKYRDTTGIPARLVVVGMLANKFSIADPRDKGSLDVVGFDTATPGIISDFSAGRI